MRHPAQGPLAQPAMAITTCNDEAGAPSLRDGIELACLPLLRSHGKVCGRDTMATPPLCDIGQPITVSLSPAQSRW
jgi:hypothetical protein